MKVYTCIFWGLAQEMEGSMVIVAETEKEALEYAEISLKTMPYGVESLAAMIKSLYVTELDLHKKGVTVITDGDYC